ncbi:MAG TPA: IMP dehydrogenase, partial [Bdellovibrionales bacterium]|nr:IMP dehydrogenase [Bdellovibrionales bacterium]
PIISANMDTITEAPMAIAMQTLGAFGLLHRFMPIQDQAHQVRMVREAGFDNVGASVGVNTDERERAEALVAAGANVLVIDIAHGHSVAMIETVKYLKDTFPSVDVIAGNVATPEATRDLIAAGADAIKVGIGPGSMCTTRVITGCGVPQLTAIAICALAAEDSKTPIIADGGIKTSGDIVKAFAAGASSVMLGSMLSGTLETPGEIKSGQKHYRGMASKQAQISWRGGVPEGMAAEGEATLVPVKGPVKDVILEICGGIRSGMSYINASEVGEIRDRARFIEMSQSGVSESHAHGLWTYSARRPL